MKYTRSFIALLLTYSICLSVIAGPEKDKWTVNESHGDEKEVSFELSEGTWMNLDVSPDGQWISFDLLGDIYIMPITGGDAKVIQDGRAYQVQPRFSPDGKYISFTSDEGGGDNIWIYDRGEDSAWQVTNESFRLLNNAVWTPDGEYLIARKHFTSSRSLGAGEIWMYHKSGGSGIQLTKKKNDQQDAGEPCVSPDGRYVYFSEDMYPGGYFQYNKDPNKQIYAIRRYDLKEGKLETVTGGPGGAFRPQISHDGKTMAFVKRIRTETVLYLRDLESGEERPLFKSLSKDQQEAWAIFGVYTNFNWTPDDSHIIVWAGGKIHKINVSNGSNSEIPFKLKSTHHIAKALRFKQEVSPDKFTAKVIRHLVTSPDGKTVVFNAAGYLYKKSLPDGKPTRLTSNSDFEFEPSFSKDGRYLVYVSWNDEEAGKIHKMDMKSGKDKVISTNKAIYRVPSFSYSGKHIVFRKEGANGHQGSAYTAKTGLFYMNSDGTNEQFITKSGDYPSFVLGDDAIYFQTGGYFFGGLNKKFKSIKLDGTDERVIATSKYANRFYPSPDGKWIAFNELHKVYVTLFPQTGKELNLSAGGKVTETSVLSRDAGINVHWSSDSKSIHWTLGEEYYSKDLKDRFTFLPEAPDSLPPLDSMGVKIGLVLKTDKPTSTFVFTNARIITMEGDQVIENGSLIVENNKIKALGKAADITAPAGAKVIDVSGKTIIPGLVDVHAHLGTFRYGISPQKQWSYWANLAYGVTTTHDPSSNTEMVFSQSEMVKSGAMVGPRIYSTGIILYGADGDFKAVVNSLDDARSSIRRTKAFGAFSVKSYNQPRRDQRQQVIQAAKEEQIMVVPEGGSFFYHNMSMILDGHSGVEHNIPVAPAYKDVIDLWSASGTGYTPTLIVAYGAIKGEDYFYQKHDVWKNEKLLRFTPRAVIDTRARHRNMVPDEEYENGFVLASKSCAELSKAGVKVNLGAHGQLQGLGVHWELWMLHKGGMSEMEALRSATLNGAHYIGMDHQIGSLKEGKLADFIVLGANPLEDIMNTEKVEYTIMNGRVYDADTMTEITPTSKVNRAKFWWELQDNGDSFPWHDINWSPAGEHCKCHMNH